MKNFNFFYKAGKQAEKPYKMGFPRVCIFFLKPYPEKFFLFFSNIDIIFSLYIIESMMT
ncbi:hypothetical protein HMPREF1547_01955 [Blautia sp. KLE 1732]|nr:hypothetical protein HMPREF1547_01955 [Blautia sp. KLE 1732]